MKQLFKSSDGDLRWGWKAAILIVGTIIFGIILNTVVMTVLTISFASQGIAQEQAMENATVAASGFLAQVVMSALQLGFMLWLVRWLVTKVEKQKFDWSKLGLEPAERSKYIVLGIGLALVLSLLTIGIGYLSGTLKFAGNGFELFGSSQVLVTLFLTTILAVASGFGEEIAFRGYLQSRIATRYNPVTAVMIVAMLFAFSHPLANTVNPLLYVATAILVGILFGAVLVRTRSLWMGIALHTVWNYMQIAVLAVRNSVDGRFFGAPLFVFDTISGVSQMLVELAVIAVGLLIIFWLTIPAVKKYSSKG